MSYNIKEIKQGIKLHCIDTNKFKTNLMAVFITLPLNKERVTFDTVIPAVLKRGTTNLKSQEEISKKLENMYGASFDCGIEKIGDNHVIKFYLEALNENFIPENSNQNISKDSIDLLLDIIFNPLVENNKFKEEYVQAEKNNIKLLIESKIDNKDQYALNRCIEEMYKDKPYGLYKFGYVEDLEKITSENLYEYYMELINNSKIDIFVSGELNIDNIVEIIENNQNVKKLKERQAKFVVNNEQTENKQEAQENVIEEKMDITQGKLVIGLDVELNDQNSKFPVSIYNVILRRKCNIKIIPKCKRKGKFSIYSKIKLCKTKKQYIYKMWNRNRKL